MNTSDSKCHLLVVRRRCAAAIQDTSVVMSMANVEREISFDKTLVTGSRLVTAGNEDIRDDLTGCGRAVDGKCGFVEKGKELCK